MFIKLLKGSVLFNGSIRQGREAGVECLLGLIFWKKTQLTVEFLVKLVIYLWLISVIMLCFERRLSPNVGPCFSVRFEFSKQFDKIFMKHKIHETFHPFFDTARSKLFRTKQIIWNQVISNPMGRFCAARRNLCQTGQLYVPDKANLGSFFCVITVEVCYFANDIFLYKVQFFMRIVENGSPTELALIFNHFCWSIWSRRQRLYF